MVIIVIKTDCHVLLKHEKPVSLMFVTHLIEIVNWNAGTTEHVGSLYAPDEDDVTYTCRAGKHD